MTAPARLETATAYRVIGAPMKRKEDFRLLTGRGKYAADLRLPGLAARGDAEIAASHTRASGRSREGGARGARRVRGDHRGRSRRSSARIPVRLGQRAGVGPTACLQPPLAAGDVRYVGEPIAFVVAESRYLAEDALELIEVD